MSVKLPRAQAAQIRNIVYAKADAHHYISRARNENGQFMTALVDDPDVGGVLSAYMEKEAIRTYIKDTILNRYTKRHKDKILEGNSPTDTIQKVYSVASGEIQTAGCVTVCRSEDGRIFVVSSGDLRKWETALKKALELIARQPKLVVGDKFPEICLQLAVLNHGLTDGDKKLITDALNVINVKARFCGG